MQSRVLPVVVVRAQCGLLGRGMVCVKNDVFGLLMGGLHSPVNNKISSNLQSEAS